MINLKGEIGLKRMVWLTVMLLVVGTFLAACGSAKQEAQENKTAAPSQANPAGTPADTRPLKVGVILTTSGPLGAIGAKQLTGVQMAIEEINAAGGILGRKVELLVRDDAADPTKTRTAAQELVEKEGVTMIIGPTLSSPALALAPYLTEQKVAMMGSFSAVALNDPQKYPYAFSGSPLSDQQAAVVVNYAVDTLKAKKIGIISESAGYGKSATADFTTQLKQRGIEPAAVEVYPQGAIDMSAQLNNLKKAGVEAVLGATLGADSVRIIKGMQSMGWQVPFLGNSDLSTAPIIEGVGKEGMKLVYSYYQERLTFSDTAKPNPKAKAFADKLAKRLNQTPLQDSVLQQSLFYDIAYMLRKAVEDAKSVDGQKVSAALEQMKNFDGAHATFTFSNDDHGGLDLDDLNMVKAASFQDGFYAVAPGK